MNHEFSFLVPYLSKDTAFSRLPGGQRITLAGKRREKKEVEMKHIFLAEKTEKGPALWEGGGSYDWSGWSLIITGPNGEKKSALKLGFEPFLRHALVPISEGDYIIDFESEAGQGWRIFVYQVKKIFRQCDGATAVEVEEVSYSRNDLEWDHPLPKFLFAAVEVAKRKGTKYMCNSAMYVE
jgi:hypothetical protein